MKYFSFKYLMSIEFNGKLWKPMKPEHIVDLYYIENVHLPAGDLPFSLLNKVISFTFSGDSTFYGTVYGYEDKRFGGSAKFASDAIKTINIIFLKEFELDVDITSPYFNVTFSDFNSLDTQSRTREFPVTFSFNEYSSSHVYFEKFRIKEGETLTASRIICYPTITKSYSDSELDEFSMLKNGFAFFDMPPDTYNVKKFAIRVSRNSISQINNVIGFTEKSILMEIFAEKIDRIILKAQLSKRTTDPVARICFSARNSQFRCPDSSAAKISPTTNGDFSQHIPKGYKTIIIDNRISYTTTVHLNFDTLPNDNYTIIIRGSTDIDLESQKVKITSTKGKINILKAINIKFEGNADFDMNIVNFYECFFPSNYDYKFSENTIVRTDAVSFKQLSVNSPAISTLVVKNDVHNFEMLKNHYTHSRVEEIFSVIGQTKVSFGIRGYQINTGEAEEQIASIDTTTIRSIELHASYDLVVKITDGQNIKSAENVKIVVEPAVSTSYRRFGFSLEGEGFFDEMKEPIHVDFGSTELNITVTTPDQTKNFNFTGKGSKIFTLDYNDKKPYCFYDKSFSITSCYDESKLTPQFEINDSIASSFSSINISNPVISIDLVSKPVNVPYSLFNKRKVSIQTSDGFNDSQEIEIDFQAESVDPIFSLAIFQKIKTVYNGQTDLVAKFGQLELGSQFEVNEGWTNHIKLDVPQIVCEFADLQKFKTVRINDQITLSGKIPKIGKSVLVDFTPDDDANDLIAEIGEDVTIAISREKITIGLFSFQITHSMNYDAYFTIIDNASVTIECDSDVDVSTFPKFVIDAAQNNSIQIKFNGKFPKIEPNEESLILLLGGGEVSLEINSEGYLPVSYPKHARVLIKTNVSFSQLHGAIDYIWDRSTESMPIISFSSTYDGPVVIELVNGISISNVNYNSKDIEELLLSINSSKITVHVNKIFKTNPNIAKAFMFYSTIGETGSSKLVFHQPLPDEIEFSEQTFIISEVTGEIKNEDEFPFIKNPETIIEGFPQDINSHRFQFSYLSQSSGKRISHGFNSVSNTLDIKIAKAGDKSVIQLFAYRRPSQIPFIIDFCKNCEQFDSELVINEDNIDLLDDISKVLKIKYPLTIFQIRNHMLPNESLNLASFLKISKKATLMVRSHGNTILDAYTTVPSSSGLSISYYFVNLGFDQTGKKIEADLINFTDCEFKDGKNVIISNAGINTLVLDVDTLNELVSIGSLKSFENNMIVNSANVIVFTKDGWEFREHKVKPTVPITMSAFPKVSFETRLLCSLIIEDETLNQIHGFPFNVYAGNNNKAYFELSRNWKNIKNLDGFKIKVNDAERVFIDTASYMIPWGMFDVPPSIITFTFEIDSSRQFDIITLNDGRVFINETFTADMQNLPEEYQVIKGKTVIFNGNNQFLFFNDKGRVQLEKAIVERDSSVSFGSAEILELLSIDVGSQVDGSIDFSSKSKIVYKWTIDKIPLIKQSLNKNSFPESFELEHTASDIDKDEYRNKLLSSGGVVIMSGQFNCPIMRSRISFTGGNNLLGQGNQYLTVFCDRSVDGQILVLKGIKDIEDDNANANDDKGAKVASGGIAGIVIAVAIVVGCVVAFAVYCYQRKRIDTLKNKIPAGTSSVYEASKYETKETMASRVSDDDFAEDIY